MIRITAVISNMVDFLKTGIWRIRLQELPKRKAFFLKQVRIFLLATHNFIQDQCTLRAASLTFYSLLSIVPILALVFGIARGFGFEAMLRKQLTQNLPGQEEVLKRTIGFAHSLIETTRGGVVVGIGVILLFLTVIKVLNNIERSLNDIWRIRKQRTLQRKFSDYLSIILIAPILMALASSATIYVTTKVTEITEKVALLDYFTSSISFGLKAVPYCLAWLLFTLIYVTMPNTRVKFSSGFFAGLVAGTIYQLTQWGYINFQVGVAKYNAIYGSFAALPLFLIWLNLSWLIVLFGAEVAFSFQNVDNYELENDYSHLNPYLRKVLSLQIAHLLIRNFAEAIKPLPAKKISTTLDIPVPLVHQILLELVESGTFTAVTPEEDKETVYQPASDINRFTVNYIVDRLEHRGNDTIPFAQTETFNTLSETLQEFSDTIEKAPANKLLKDM